MGKAAGQGWVDSGSEVTRLLRLGRPPTTAADADDGAGQGLAEGPHGQVPPSKTAYGGRPGGTGPGPRHPVDNGASLAPDEVGPGPKGGAGPVDLGRRVPG